MDPAEEEIRAEIAAGRKIEAIRLYRERYGAGLKEAKDAVEVMARGEAAPPREPVPPIEESMLRPQIEELLRGGQKIEAIRLYREQTGCGLKEARDAVEAFGASQGLATRSGCFLATAAFGPAAPEVAVLRRYRDRVLRRSRSGRAFVRVYYRLSPAVAAWLARPGVLRSPARAGVRRLTRPLAAAARRRLERSEGKAGGGSDG